MLNTERFEKLYKDVEFFLNNAPVEDDCTDDENEIYCELANLKNVIDNCRDRQIKPGSTKVRVHDNTTGYGREIWDGVGVAVK